MTGKLAKIAPGPVPEKFAKFAIIDPALEDPTLIYRQAPRAQFMSERAFSTPHPSPCAQGEGL